MRIMINHIQNWDSCIVTALILEISCILFSLGTDHFFFELGKSVYIFNRCYQNFVSKASGAYYYFILHLPGHWCVSVKFGEIFCLGKKSLSPLIKPTDKRCNGQDIVHYPTKMPSNLLFLHRRKPNSKKTNLHMNK